MDTVPAYQPDAQGQFDRRAVVKLVDNYRSHRLLLELSSKEFYQGELVPCAGPLAYSLERFSGSLPRILALSPQYP